MNGEVISEGRHPEVRSRGSDPLVAIAKAYLKLAPAFPPKRWTAPQPLERARIEYDDEVAGGFLKWFPGVNVRGLSIFDIGSGYGGRPARYRELGARKVTGVEVLPEMVEESRAFAESKGLTDMEFHLAEGEHLPFGDESFDLITSYDVFEHVHEVDKALDECMRVLRPGGAATGGFSALLPSWGLASGRLCVEDAVAERVVWAQDADSRGGGNPAGTKRRVPASGDASAR